MFASSQLRGATIAVRDSPDTGQNDIAGDTPVTTVLRSPRRPPLQPQAKSIPFKNLAADNLTR